MKLTTLMLFVTVMQVSASSSYAQRLTLKRNSVTVFRVFQEINRQTGYDVFYLPRAIDTDRAIRADFANAGLDEVMTACLDGQNASYTIEEKTIVIAQTPVSNQKQAPSQPDLTIDVRGVVIDEAGKPLVGASVIVKGTTRGILTDPAGIFLLPKVTPGATLAISYIGLKTRELKARPDMGTIRMESESQQIQEVVVNKGYYTDRKATSTSNVATVTSREIENSPVNNPLLALSGRATGVTVKPLSGMPGQGMNVSVQGLNSISRGTTPFFVVDGVPLSPMLPNSAYNLLDPSGGGSVGEITGGGNPFYYINPADIESITVLKDADATAIYGSQAANGAIVITTKKARAGQTRVDVDIQKGWGKVPHFVDMMGIEEHLAMRKEAYANDGLPVPSFQANPQDNVNVNSRNYDLTTWDPNRETDWQKALIGGTANYTDIQASVSGGSEKTSFRISGGYHRETMVFPGDYANEKASMGASLSHTSANERFRLQFSGNFMADENNLPGTDLTANALKMAPNAPALRHPDGSLNWARIPNSTGTDSVSTWSNPLANQFVNYTARTNNLLGNLQMEYSILKGLNVKVSAGYNNMTLNDLNTTKMNAAAPERRRNTVRNAASFSSRVNSWVIEPQILYNGEILKGTVTAMAGATFRENVTRSMDASANGFSSDAMLANFSAATTRSASTNESRYRYNALFGRFNYNHADRYVVNLTARRDGTSRFGAQRRLHDFWSAAGAWIVTNESFLKDRIEPLSFLKLRASYGTTGNQQIGDYQYLSLYYAMWTPSPYQDISSLQPIGLANPYLEWEETRKLALGLELGFFNDRLELTADYFRNRSSNQLISYGLPSQTGHEAITMNQDAKVQNSGWEFVLRSINLRGKDWQWTSSLNISMLRNKLLAYPNLESSPYATMYTIGKPIDGWMMYKYLGPDPETGEALFRTADGGTTTTPDWETDRIYRWSQIPTLTGGFSNTLTWKGFTLDVLFEFAKQERENFYKGYSPGSYSYGVPKEYADRWQKPGDVAKFPKLSTNGWAYSTALESTLIMSDASYIRLKNISFSYRFPQKIQDKLSLKNLTLILIGQNVLTFTNYVGMDPESYNRLPPLRLWTVGIKASF